MTTAPSVNEDMQKAIIQWGSTFLLSHGYRLKRNLPEIVQHTPWSYVIRFITTEGDIYLKKTPTLLSLEAPIIQILQDQFDASVPKIIANNIDLNCFLMKDAGKSIREILKVRFDEGLIFKSIAQFTSLQLSVADHLKVFLDLGVPDWRLNQFPDLYLGLLNKKEILLADGLSEIEISQLVGLVPKVNNLCKKLSGYAIKQTIVQPDFNDNNSLIDERTQKITIIDLGEISISHPFFSLINYLKVIQKHHGLTNEDAAYQRIKNACLENYRQFESKINISNAFKIAEILAFIYSTLAGYRLLDACDQSKFILDFQRHTKPGASLKGLISACKNMMGSDEDNII